MKQFTYPTEQMSIEEYRAEKEKQFGERFPLMDAKCLYCRQEYGEHYGLECPKKQGEE